MLTSTIRIKNASFFYGKKCIFSCINLTLSPGKWVGLLGQSGVGKTSLLRMIAGLVEIKTGEIEIDNSLPANQQIAYMGQTDLLLPWQTTLENATLGLKLRKKKQANPFMMEQAISLLQKVGLKHALHLYPYQLSGGMRQRVALVRTLMENKPVILMDEPFSALDAITRYQLQDLASELLQNKTVLFVTHDPNEALKLSHEIFIMQGRPATLKSIITLTSKIPRELFDEKMIKLQSSLFHELTKAADELT